MAAARAPSARNILVLSMLALVALRLAGMDLLPLMDTTEARYADIGRRMATLGDWVTPWHEQGVPFWGKPPLSFWLTAASFKLLGVNEFAARLPHFLCAVIVGALVWAVGRMRDAREALLAVAVLGGSALFFVSAGAVMTDGELVLGTTLSMCGFWIALHAPAARGRSLGGWMFFGGLVVGVLAKGPLALVLVAAPLLAWTAMQRQWHAVARALPWGAGTSLAVLAAVPWFLLAEARTPGFLSYFIVGEHWHRFVTPGWTGDLYGHAHRAPPGAIWLFALMSLLPWPLVVAFAWLADRKAPAGADAGAPPWQRYVLLWTLAPLVFFTAARNIIWTYALPALPAASLWIAHWLTRRTTRAEGWAVAGLAIMVGVGVLGTVMVDARHLTERRTAKGAVQAFQRQAAAGQPLVFVGDRPFSAAFYSAGAARRVSRPAEVASLASHNGAIVAMRSGPASAGQRGEIRAAGLLIDAELGQYGEFELVRVVPGPVRPPQGGTAPAP